MNSIGCIVVTGAGERAFSAGGDIHEQREDDRRFTQDKLDCPPRPRRSYEIAILRQADDRHVEWPRLR